MRIANMRYIPRSKSLAKRSVEEIKAQELSKHGKYGIFDYNGIITLGLQSHYNLNLTLI